MDELEIIEEAAEEEEEARAVKHQAPHRSGGRFFENRISLGNILTLIALIASVAAVWTDTISQVQVLKSQGDGLQRQIDEINRNNEMKDNRWQADLSSVKGDIRDLRQMFETQLMRPQH